MMRVSVIIVREPDIFNHKQRNFFDSFVRQTYSRESFELIFVDPHRDASTDISFREFRDHHPDIAAHLLYSPNPARAMCNNMAAAQATGDLLIFLADDFDPSPGFIEAHAEYHAFNRDLNAVGIGSGLFTDETRQDPFARWVEDSGQLFGVPMRSVMANWPSSYFYAGNSSMKKAKFDMLGGFNERFNNEAWDDFEFGLRWSDSGGYSQFIAGAWTIHRHAVSFEERCFAMEIAGKAARVLQDLHPSRHHAWLEKIPEPPLATPMPTDLHDSLPTYKQVAIYTASMDAAFRSGYLNAGAAGKG